MSWWKRETAAVEPLYNDGIWRMPPGFKWEPMPDYRIAKLELREGDVLVFKVAGRLTKEQDERVTILARRCLPDGVKLLVLDGSTDIAVLTKSEIENRAA